MNDLAKDGETTSTSTHPSACPSRGEEFAMKSFTIESIYAAWHAAGIDILGGEWDRFVEILTTKSPLDEGFCCGFTTPTHEGE